MYFDQNSLFKISLIGVTSVVFNESLGPRFWRLNFLRSLCPPSFNNSNIHFFKSGKKHSPNNEPKNFWLF